MDPPFSDPFQNLFSSSEYIQKKKGFFGDLKFVSSLGNSFDAKSPEIRKNKVIAVAEVQKAIQKYIEQRKLSLVKNSDRFPSESRLKSEANALALRYAGMIESKIKKWLALVFGYGTHKSLKLMYKSVNYEPKALEKIKAIQGTGPVIYISNHRSYNLII